MNGDLAEAARLAAQTAERVVLRLIEAEKAIDAANDLMVSMLDDDQEAGTDAIDRLAVALRAYNKIRGS